MGGSSPRRRRWWRAAHAVAWAGACLLATSCGSHATGDPFPEIALHLTDGKVEMLSTSCPPTRVSSVTLVRPDPSHAVIAEDEPVVWRVTFAAPTTLSAFTVGEAPPGGGQAVALAAPLDSAVRYHGAIVLDDGRSQDGDLDLMKLQDGTIYYHDQYLSPDAFAAARLSCRSTSP
jgi:hypothetical protein